MVSKHFSSLLMAGVAALLVASPAQATVITFDDLPKGTVVANQYAGVSCSTAPGYSVVSNAYGGGGIGWDNLSFDAGTSVREPASLALVLLAAGTATLRSKRG